MLKNTGVFPSLSVATTGQSLVSHAGLNVLASFVDAFDVRDVCEDRLGQFVPSGATHRPGTILGSLALMLAAGGEHVSDLDILRTSPGVFGKVASNATISRFFERTVANPDLFEYGFATMSCELRSRVWAAAGDRNPALRATALEPLIIDLDLCRRPHKSSYVDPEIMPTSVPTFPSFRGIRRTMVGIIG